MGGRVLLTTGSKDLSIYGGLLDPELLYPRVLPLVSSIEACEDAGIPHRNIIAVQGPFSEELNKAVIREYEIDVMITKDSGAAGGFPEKISAAKDCQIPVIVIARPEEEGLSFNEILAMCRERMK
jgi:precorrin-6x reductase